MAENASGNECLKIMAQIYRVKTKTPHGRALRGLENYFIEYHLAGVDATGLRGALFFIISVRGI